MSTLNRCRLCLKLVRNKIPIFKNDFPKMIELLTGLKVDPNDDFPKTSCIDCAINLKISLRTKRQIIQSHKTLLEEFLAKCKDTDIVSTISNSEIKSINRDHIVGNDSNKSNVIECKTKPDKIEELVDTNISRLRMRPLRLGTQLESVTPDGNVTTRKKRAVENCKQSAVTDKSKIENSAFNHDNVKCESQEEYNSESDEEPASPVPDPAFDADWTPNKKDEVDTVARETPKKTILKASEGVFFVRKRNTSIGSKKKTAETVIRIKKKPKGRKTATRVTCEICKKEVQSNWFKKHMETHEYNPATCEFCGLISKSATALRHHVFYYHRSSADQYVCDQCGRCFRSKYRLNLHKKKEHGGTKDFECTTCGKKFFEKMHLKRHVDKTHKNIRPYVCDFCGKTFKSRNHIKIHERIHSKEAPYTCHMCGESFKMKLTLRTHLRGVHNVQEVQKVFCDICKRGFASDVALKAHVNSRIHETDKCQYCSEMFTREYMVNHLRDVHEIQVAGIN